MKFTGYWQIGTTKLYFMKNIAADDGVVTFGIKGGSHSLLSERLDPYQQAELLFSFAKGCGFNFHKKGSGWEVYVNSSKYGGGGTRIFVGKKKLAGFNPQTLCSGSGTRFSSKNPILSI